MMHQTLMTTSPDLYVSSGLSLSPQSFSANAKFSLKFNFTQSGATHNDV